MAGRTFFYDAEGGGAVEESALEEREAAGPEGGEGGEGDAAGEGEGEEEGEEEGAEETEAELLGGFKWGMAVECTSAEEGLQARCSPPPPLDCSARSVVRCLPPPFRAAGLLVPGRGAAGAA